MRYINHNKHSCCQLISALNALIYFDKEPPSLNSPEFESLVDTVKCRHGSALSVEKVYPQLGLDFQDGPATLNWIHRHLPVELSIWSRRQGFHSILVVKIYGNVVQIANYTKGRLQALKWQQLEKVIAKQNKKVMRCRSFKISGSASS